MDRLPSEGVGLDLMLLPLLTLFTLMSLGTEERLDRAKSRSDCISRMRLSLKKEGKIR